VDCREKGHFCGYCRMGQNLVVRSVFNCMLYVYVFLIKELAYAVNMYR